MKLDKKIQAKKLLTRATTLALLVKERKRATAVRKQTAAAVHIKQQEALERKLTAALTPMFSRQIDSAIRKLKEHEDLYGVRAWMLFDPSQWNDELVNRALPPMAKAMAEAMLTEVVMFEKDLRRYVKSTRLMRRMGAKVFCPTGEGGGRDPHCGRRDGTNPRFTEEEVTAIRQWVGVDQSNLSLDDYRHGDSQQAKVLRDLVDAAPPVNKTLYRGTVIADPSILKPDQVVDLPRISSFSETLEVARGFSSQGQVMARTFKLGNMTKVVYQVNGVKNGLDVSKVADSLSGQREVLSNGKIRIQSVVLGNDGTYLVQGEHLPTEKKTRKTTYVRTKATTATEWLQDNFPHTDLEEVVYATPYGNVAMNLATEFPAWMKASIRERLEETFSQSYWDDINVTTQGDIADLLNEGLENGWSIETMAKEMNERYGEAYSKNRGRLIARTESGNALNGARVKAIDDLIGELGPEIAGTIKKVWHSVLGNTTRETHANLDGVPADTDGKWALGGVRCRWPSDVVLPMKERGNCQCTVITQFGMSDAYAQEEIAQSEIRQMQQGKAVKTAVVTTGHNCGIGPGGFQPGNTCARGGGWKKGDPIPEFNYYSGGKWAGYNSKAIASISGVDPKIVEGLDTFDTMVTVAISEKYAKGDWPPNAPWGLAQVQKCSPEVKAIYTILDHKHQADIGQLPEGAKPTKTDPAVASEKGWVKIGGKLGTEEGGTYEMGGKKYYVKTPDNPARAHNEVLAFKLYEAAGGSAASAHLVEIDGKKAIATEWMDAQKIDWNKNTSAKIAAAEDFALHAWLNNRDAVGAGSENPMDNIKLDTATGKPTLVDAGGSLDYKGMGGGGKKPFGKDAEEWDTLRDPSKNPTTAKVFGDMTPAQLIASGEKLKNITDETINELVNKYHGGSQSERLQMRMTLKQRRAAILQKIEDLKAASTAKAPPSKPPEQIVAEAKAALAASKSAGPVSLPPPPHAGPQVVKDKMAELYAAASSGDINKLHAVKTNPNATSPYPKKMHDYKMQLMTAMQAGGKPVQSHVVQPPATAPKPTPVAVSNTPQVILPGPVKIKPGEFPSKPTFTSSNKANVEANGKAVEEALKIAEKGDLAALQAHGQTIPASPKLKAWHQALVDEVSNQLNPPPPPVSLDRDFAAASSHISPKAVDAAKKIGYWAVLGEVPGIPVGTSKGDWMKNVAQKTKMWDEGAKAAKGSGALDQIKSYTGGGYASMNESLRNGDFSSDTGQRALKVANAIMQHGTIIPQGIKISRKHSGVSSSDWYSVKPGTVISEKAMLSTSIKEDVWSGSTRLVMTIGPGVKGMPVKTVSNYTHEDEIILAPNQRMLVTKVEKQKQSWGDDNVTVHVTVLPTLDTQCCPP